MTKTLPNIADPHMRIYREIGQQVLASIEDGWTDTHTDRRTNFIYKKAEICYPDRYDIFRNIIYDRRIIEQ